MGLGDGCFPLPSYGLDLGEQPSRCVQGASWPWQAAPVESASEPGCSDLCILNYWPGLRHLELFCPCLREPHGLSHWQPQEGPGVATCIKGPLSLWLKVRPAPYSQHPEACPGSKTLPQYLSFQNQTHFNSVEF